MTQEDKLTAALSPRLLCLPQGHWESTIPDGAEWERCKGAQVTAPEGP